MKRINARISLRRLVSLWLALLLTATVFGLFACDKAPTPPDSETESGTLEDSASTTEQGIVAPETLPESLKNYRVVYAIGSPDRVVSAANTLARQINLMTDSTDVRAVADTFSEKELEILVGETDRSTLSASGMFLYDYSIKFDGKKLVLLGGSGYALENAVNKLVELLQTNSFKGAYEYKFDTSLFNPLAFDQGSFVPVWAGTRAVPTWVTNYEEKLCALTKGGGRPMTIVHRATDAAGYPENTLEGGLSACLLGADMLELDLRLTKDNVIVVTHDKALSSSTDFFYKRGKNGLPMTDDIGDWTFAQLKQLCLLDVNGHMTKYTIPSYYEFAKATDGRCFLILDKKEKSINYEDVLDVLYHADNVESALYAMFTSADDGPSNAKSLSVVKEFSAKHPELEELSAILSRLDGYLSVPGAALCTRGSLGISGASTKNPKETFAIYQKCYNSGVKLFWTNDIRLATSFVYGYRPDLT